MGDGEREWSEELHYSIPVDAGRLRDDELELTASSAYQSKSKHSATAVYLLAFGHCIRVIKTIEVYFPRLGKQGGPARRSSVITAGTELYKSHGSEQPGAYTCLLAYGL